MTISYLKDIGFLLIESPKLDEVIANPSGYSKVLLSGDLNCGACDSLFSQELAISSTAVADLNTQVQLGKTITKFKFINSATDTIDTAVVDIDLSGVTNSCISGNCTLETSPTNYADIFINELEDYFASIPVPVGTIVVSFDDNKFMVSGIPANYTFLSFEDEDGETGTFSLGTSESGLLLSNEGLLVAPAFFNLTEFVDGVYRFDLKIVASDNSYSLESNCAFVDISFQCKVATYLDDVVREAQNKDAEKVGTVAHMLHYGLVNSGNCGCNCADLCKAYKELYSILNSSGLITQTSSDCGC